LLATRLAGDQVALFGGVRAVPQPIRGHRRAAFSGDHLLLLNLEGLSGAIRRRKGNRDIVDNAKLNGADHTQRPRKVKMQTGAEHGHGEAKSLIGSSLIERHRRDPGNAPSHHRHSEDNRNHRPPNEGKRPAAGQVDAELALHRVIERLKIRRREPQQAGNGTVGDRLALLDRFEGHERHCGGAKEQLNRNEGRQDS
jgi:hypothetical protein